MNIDEKILELTDCKMSVEYISKKLGCSKHYVKKVRDSFIGYKPYNESELEKRKSEFPKELLDEWEKVTAKLRRCFK